MSTQLSPKSSDPSGEQVYRKPRADVYTVLLLIALIALILATVALWALMGDYDNKFKGGPVALHRPAATAADAGVAIAPYFCDV